LKPVSKPSSAAVGTGKKTAMTDPARAERLWLVRSVSTLWVLSVGGQANRADSAAGFDDLPLLPIRSVPDLHPRPRLLNCFTRGVALILAALLRGDPLPSELGEGRDGADLGWGKLSSINAFA